MSDDGGRMSDDGVTNFLPEVLARLSGWKLRAQHLAAGLAFGVHTSRRQGLSAEFIDHRPWVPGDDPKNIDWRAAARTGKPVLRRFVEDTNATFYLLLDRSGSMNYRGARAALGKREYAECVAATLAFLALRQNDRVGVTVFDEARVASLRVGSGEAHWGNCLEFFDQPPLGNAPKHAGSLPDVLNRFAETCTRPGTLLLLSDFLDVERFDAVRNQFRHLLAARHHVQLFHVLDPDELDFPFRAPVRFLALESAETFSARDAEDLRAAYLDQVAAWRQDLALGCRELDIPIQTALTTRPVDQTVREL